MKCRKDYPESDLRTQRQWAEAGYIVIPAQAAKGRELYTSYIHQAIATYFDSSQVVLATTDDQLQRLADYLTPIKERSKARRKARRQYLKQLREREREYRREQDRLRDILRQGWALCMAAEPVPPERPAEVIALDLETTGLNKDPEALPDEILQVAVIDGSGQTLLSSYVKPYAHDKWPDAQAVNHITPEMVAEAPYLHEVAGRIKGLLNAAQVIVGYNHLGFDLPFLRRAMGPDVARQASMEDVMLQYAPIYGEWSEKYQDYRWQHLTDCAAHYDIQYHAHDALEDARATLTCWRKIKKEEENGHNDDQ